MRYQFEGFTFDPDRGLFLAGSPVDLEPLAHQLLHYLIQNAGRVVSRDELNEKLWDGRAVSDAALSTQVRSVRRALGDDRLRQDFVRTYPRRGFSFVAKVAAVDRMDEPAPPRESRAGPRKPRLGAGALAALVLLAAGLWLAFGRTPVAPDPPDLSIAVLPFDNLSGDPTLDYLADAFTEELVTDLSRIRDAFVISRSTTFTYRGTNADAARVARELGVRYVLEGSLRVDGDQVRINAQLIDGRSNSHLWSDRYDQPLDSLFELRDGVTGRIASVLRAELRIADAERQDPELTRDAWDYALRGNVILYNHESVADYQEAHRLLSKAVALDPSISSAWGGLAFVHYVASVSRVPGVSSPASAQHSLDAALRAVDADPMNAEPYWLVGAGYARLGQPDRGMAACETAMRLNPNMDCGHVCAGLVHLARGEPEAAVPYFQYALKLNPRFRPFTKEKFLGLAYIQSGRDDMAIEALNRALSKAPDDTFATLALAAALSLDGRPGEARDALSEFSRSTGKSPPPIGALRQSIAWMGPDVERMFDGLKEAGLDETAVSQE